MSTRKGTGLARQITRCMMLQDARTTRVCTRSIATEAKPVANATTTTDQQPSHDVGAPIHPLQHKPPANPFIIPAQCTLYSFPQMEPTGFATYPSTHLQLPLRRDLLHRAVTFEADLSRQGTASTKWRGDVHGSNRKVRPQKGSGKARLGDKKSPMLKGGGVAFGPKPRDFSTDLPEKMYDLAWRTALSYRYRRGQLLVIDGKVDVDRIHRDSRVRYLKEMLEWHKMGHSAGRSLIVTTQPREAITEAFQDQTLMRDAELLAADDVDVKDLLELGRIVIEQSALDSLLRQHQSDLPVTRRLHRMQGFEAITQPSTLTTVV